MAIVASDIKQRLSTTAGSAGNTLSGTVGSSLGKYISTTDVSGTPLNDLFPDVTGNENLASNVDYQCVFVYNSHGTLTLQNTVVYISAQVAGGAVAAIGVDTTTSLAVGSSSVQALTIANKNTAPAGVSFSAPTTRLTGLSLGNIAPGFVMAFWIQRTSANTAALNNDGATIIVSGDTGA